MKNTVLLRSKKDINTFTTRDWLIRSVSLEYNPHCVGYINYIGYVSYTNSKFADGLLPVFKI